MSTPLQGSTSWFYAELLDKDDTKLNSDQIATLTITIYDKLTRKVINSRYNADVIADVATIVDSSRTKFNFEFEFTPADNAIVSGNREDGDIETHIIVVQGTTVTTGYAFKTKDEVLVEVHNEPINS